MRGVKHSLKSCADTRISIAQETMWVWICNLLKYPAYSLVGTLDLPRYVHDFHTGYADQMSRIVVHQGSQAFVKSTRYSIRDSPKSRQMATKVHCTYSRRASSQANSPQMHKKITFFWPGLPWRRRYRPKNDPKSGSRIKQKWSSMLYAY